MININDVRSGMCIKYNDGLYLVLDQQHVKPGKGSAFVRTKLKNVHTGANIDVTFNAGIKVEKAILNKKEMQYLYNSGDDYIFMDMEDYSQIEVKKETLGNTVNYLKENLERVRVEPKKIVMGGLTFLEPIIFLELKDGSIMRFFRLDLDLEKWEDE